MERFSGTVRQGSDFSQGSIAGNIMRLAIPLTVAQLTVVLYNVVDRAFIGHIPGVGDLAITGIGLSMPITSIITAFANLCGMGGGPLCSMARGRGDESLAARIMGNAMTMLLTFAAVLTGVFYAFHRPILYLFGASDATIGYASDYLMIYLAGTVFVMLSLGMNPFINCQGFAATGMMTVLLGAVVNLVLDPVLIYGFHMGVKGAALATVVAQGTSTVWVVAFLTGKKAALRLRPEVMRPAWKLIRRIASLGLSGFAFGITNSVVQALGNALLYTYGAAAGGSAMGDLYVGSMTIINSLREVIFQPLRGLTQGFQPVVGYNLGAKKYGRVREAIRFISKICMLYNGVVWLLMLLFPRLFILIFNNEEALVTTTIPMLRIYFAGYIFLAFQQVGQNTFVGLGRSGYAVFFSLLRKLILVVPLMLFLPMVGGLGVYGVFLAEPVSDVVGGLVTWGVMMMIIYRRLDIPDGSEVPWK